MDVRSTYSPERKFLNSLSKSYKGDSLSRLLFRGLVTFVDRNGTDQRSRFSIQAKVLGIDSPDDKNDGRWFPPLLPIHLISIPEVGEEVLLICEEIGNINTALWISRSESPLLTKVQMGESIKSDIDQSVQKSSSQYGYESNVPTESQDEIPNPDYNIPDPRVKPGDVVVQGRSNTFIRNTFDTKNKQGVVETVTEEQEKSEGEFYSKDFRNSEGTRTVLATNADLDTLIIEELNNLQFHENYLKGTTSDGIDSSERAKNKYDTAYLLLEALQLRIISREGQKVQHAVLGETQELWLIALINLIKKLIDDIQLFRAKVATHKHMAQGPTSPPLNMPDEQQHFSSTLNTNFSTDKTNFENHKKEIPKHHSKTLGIN